MSETGFSTAGSGRFDLCGGGSDFKVYCDEAYCLDSSRSLGSALCEYAKRSV